MLEEQEAPDDVSPEDLAETIFEDTAEAARTLSPDEQEAYRRSQESVVEARRHAQTREGLLRIN
jgi:hypothetical protein